ncbi:MAG: hypothetical protein IPN40_10875 [Uliginosibacterium sp.]|nr:hypothetical protein [Uliginosibacterium sp.]
MIWIDFVLENDLSNIRLIEALSRVLDVRPDDVRVTSSIEDIAEDSAVIALKEILPGESFILQVTVYANSTGPDDGEHVLKLSNDIGMRILISSDDSSDPYEFVMVTPDGESSKVHVYPNALDELGEYKIMD